jgi:AraC family carnitine catabolism transcriptional activator
MAKNDKATIGTASEERQTRVAFVVVPRFNIMTLTTTIEPMRIANYLAPETLYEWQYLSAPGGEIVASNGMTLSTQPLRGAEPATGIVFVCGSWGCEHYDSPELINWLRRQERRGVTLAAMELGVYLLARAGLVSARQVTTHWSCMAGFAEQFPRALLREQLFTSDRNILTCAGGTAGLDLMLHLIGLRHGDQLASEVADQILHYPIRQAETAQRHTLGGVSETMHPVVKAAIGLIETNIAEPPTVPAIAARLGVSQRQLERLFRRAMGCSPVRFSQLLRLQYARVLLTSTRMSIRDVSAASGFNSLSYFSLAFAKCFGKKPSEYRQAWPDQEPAPSWPGTVFAFIEKSRARAPEQTEPASR